MNSSFCKLSDYNEAKKVEILNNFILLFLLIYGILTIFYILSDIINFIKSCFILKNN